MFYVYLLKSVNYPNQNYIGYTENIDKRLEHHNNGQSKHTSKYKPWELICFHSFRNKKHAKKFESYLKTRSGRVFAKRHFW